MADYGMNHGENRREVNESQGPGPGKMMFLDTEPERITIENLLEGLEKAIAVAREETGMLGDRIDAVLIPAASQSDEKSPRAPILHSSLGQAIDDMTARVNIITAQLRDYRVRVQL